ncbi:DUF4902 domain-containing protein [Variovorax sp. KK3]|uniref:DUF4902 domain-containing protein n=1 Tax=Variovorax sp. KK3 TaxID=1855728 RepID=UPI00097BDDF4|nr:DUF4902 domain-containing protein [Variovorax sp. KK3]
MTTPAADKATIRSPDGLLRVPMQALRTLRPVHLVSGLHEDPFEDRLHDCGQLTNIRGYTEWTDGDRTVVTLGWDWEIGCAGGLIRWHRVGLPFTNLLLVGGDRQDLPWQRSLECLGSWIDTLAWSGPACEALRIRYAGASES